MKSLLALLVFFVAFVAPIKAQVEVVRLDSTKLDRANIWGVLADAPSDMAITTAQSQHIYLRYLDSNLQEVNLLGPDQFTW
ncbi:MAG: hypothetical protein ACPG3U_09770 [Rhodothermales bacterium]